MYLETLYPSLKNFIVEIEKEFNGIPRHRVSILTQLTSYIEKCFKENVLANLVFICTHNSRRSHIAQIWAQTAAHIYELDNVFCFSGGTESTAFNPRAIKAMKEIGFSITIDNNGSNPTYHVRFSAHAPPVKVFSKAFDDLNNPHSSFAAIITCSHADENCPYIPGATVRIALTYDDPKDFDGTPFEEEKYRERVREIGREILYVFKSLKLKA